MFREFGQAILSLELDLDTFDGPWTHVAAFRDKSGWLMAARATIQSEHDLLSAELVVACDDHENTFPTWRAVHLTQCNWSGLVDCDEMPPELLDDLMCEAEGEFYARWQREMNGDLAHLFEQAQHRLEELDAKGRGRSRELEMQVADLRRRRRMLLIGSDARAVMTAAIADIETELDQHVADLAERRRVLRQQAEVAEEALWQRADVLLEVEPLYVARWRARALKPEVRPILARREGHYYAPLVQRTPASDVHIDVLQALQIIKAEEAKAPNRRPVRTGARVPTIDLNEGARRILEIVQRSMEDKAAGVVGEQPQPPPKLDDLSLEQPAEALPKGLLKAKPIFLRPESERKLIANLKERIETGERRIASMEIVLAGIPAEAPRAAILQGKMEQERLQIDFTREKLHEAVHGVPPTVCTSDDADQVLPDEEAEAVAQHSAKSPPVAMVTEPEVAELVVQPEPEPELAIQAEEPAPLAEVLENRSAASSPEAPQVPKLSGLNAIRLRLLERKRDEVREKLAALSGELDHIAVGSPAYVQKMRQHGALGHGIAQAERKLATLKAELGLDADASSFDLSPPVLVAPANAEGRGAQHATQPDPEALERRRREAASKVLTIENLLKPHQPYTASWFEFRKLLRERQAELQAVEREIADADGVGVLRTVVAPSPEASVPRASWPSGADPMAQRDMLMSELREVEACLANVDGLPRRVTFYRARREELLSQIARLSMRIASEEQRRANQTTSAANRIDEARSEVSASWAPEQVELLRRLWSEGLAANKIAERIGGTSRNAVISKAKRLGLFYRSQADIPAPHLSKNDLTAEL